MDGKLELKDTVGKIYRKSLLYMVSRAFEEEKNTKILGMQKYSGKIDPPTGLEFIYSGGPNGAEPRSQSESHGGFDNDVATMNQLLCSVLGLDSEEDIPRPFKQADLDY